MVLIYFKPSHAQSGGSLGCEPGFMPRFALTTVRLRALLTQIVEHAWYRNCCHVLGQISALLLGTTYVDERVAFSKARLTKNDSYRDRLLESEIADLVDLCEALQLSIAQRKTVFRCFGHVDFMRRASISRRELLRYCNLRETPCSAFLLSFDKDGEMTHRTRAHRSVAARWDIMQFVALCFSICTAEPTSLVAAAVQRACDNHRQEATETESLRVSRPDDEQRADISITKAPVALPRSNKLCNQIDQCLAFFPGVASTAERGLQSLLEWLYDGSTGVDFQRVHGVASIQDVVVLFPVLVYPCLWLQRVLKARFLGASTWRQLTKRRRELHSVGMTQVFVSFPEIITASNVHLRIKMRHQKKRWWQQIRIPWLKAELSAEGDEGAAHLLTPRKIVPSTNSADEVHEKQETGAFHSNSTWEELSAISDAWRVTANHALASVCLACQVESGQPGDIDEVNSFQQTMQQIIAGQLASSLCHVIWKRVVRDQGYQFANFLFESSSLKEINPSTKTAREEKRTLQRYEKAHTGASVPEDKAMYWKEFMDPLLKCTFYYNIRTGESRWERPPNFISKPRRVKRRRKKTEDKPKVL